MSKPAIAVAISIFISLTQLLGTCTATVEVLKKQSSFSKGQLMLGPYSFKEGILVYALCDLHENDYQCQVVQERPPYKDTSRVCNVTLVSEQKNGEIQSAVGIAALGKDKIILFWHEIVGDADNMKFETIQLDGCKVQEAKVVNVSLSSYMELHHTNNILTYNDDSYDVIFNDIARCGEKMCKMTINGEGKITAQPSPYITSNRDLISFASPIATRSPSKGFIYTRISDEITLWMIKPDSSEKQLSTYKRASISAISAANNFISSCLKSEMNSPMRCTQYDENGNVKFTTNLASIDEKTQILRVHSLAKGGFFMMTAKCETGSCSKAASSQIIRVDANGKEAGSFQLIDFESAIVERHWAHIYENGDDKYCAAFVGEKRTQGQMEHLNVVVNCFTNDDLKK